MLQQIGSDPGPLLRELRRGRGLTQARLAKMVDLPQSHLQKIEAGKTDPRASTVAALLRALGYELAASDLQTIRTTQALEHAVDRRPRFT
jgi:HTH-type transcriptional regulator/antitoxin HipB